MSMPAPLYYTADMVRALPDDGHRYEVVHGELLVTPAPRRWHQTLLARLHLALGTYLESKPGYDLLFSPADISWDADTLVQPDLFVVDPVHAGTTEWSDIRQLLLVIEVLSPSSTRQDRFTKRRRYQEAGVPCYWIVDGESKQVEIWTPDDRFPAFERDRLTWHPAGLPQPFHLELSQLFRPA